MVLDICLMRSLYWKIFISFWAAIIVIIFTTAWITSHITQQSTLPAREQMFMDSYANAAVATFESGQHKALLKWLNHIGISRHMALYLLTSNGEIIGTQQAPEEVQKVAKNLMHDQLSGGMFKSGKLLVSHEIMSTSGIYFRLAAITETPLPYYVQIPWKNILIKFLFATLISGLICYLLSNYLTKPLRSLGLAAKSIGTGKLNTRVGHFPGHHKDEIAELSDAFDRMAEQLETIVLSKERLLQDISHELRSPLARISVAIELARNKTKDIASTELDRMELEASRLNALISEILDFARLKQSTTELNLSWVNMPLLLNSIIQDANYECNNTHARVRAHSIAPCQLFIDERLMHRAIENVLRNALHYSPSDQEVLVSLEHNSAEQAFFIAIKDNGPGVPEQELDKIFNPFYRVDSSREKKTGGFGLGLAIAARAIQLHQGQISATNAVEGGLSVIIMLSRNAVVGM